MRSILILLFTFSSATAVAEVPCLVNNGAMHVATVIASASFWDNLLVRKGSVRKELVALVTQAHKKIPSPTTDSTPCLDCTSGSTYEIALSSIPVKFQNDYADRERCSERLTETTSKPIHFSPQEFADVDEFVEWYSDLSRGKGSQGKYLYTKCDGSCSPQYFVRIQYTPTRIVVSTDVICGHARDTADDSYTITTAIQTGCKLFKEKEKTK